MNDINSKISFDISDIQTLIDSEAEESSRLEFKASGALGKSDGKREEISKDVAAFANSDGGLIVYGVAEENHRASRIDTADGNEFTKEWLEHVINSKYPYEQVHMAGLMTAR